VVLIQKCYLQDLLKGILIISANFMAFAGGTLGNSWQKCARNYDEPKPIIAIGSIGRRRGVNRSARQEFSVPEAKTIKCDSLMLSPNPSPSSLSGRKPYASGDLPEK
jgi:hypothetical protein